jgi:hypothetical protein
MAEDRNSEGDGDGEGQVEIGRLRELREWRYHREIQKSKEE